MRFKKWRSPGGSSIFGCLGDTLLQCLSSRWATSTSNPGEKHSEHSSHRKQVNGLSLGWGPRTEMIQLGSTSSSSFTGVQAQGPLNFTEITRPSERARNFLGGGGSKFGERVEICNFSLVACWGAPLVVAMHRHWCQQMTG